MNKSERFWTFLCYNVLVGAEYWIEAALLFFLIDIAGGLGVSEDEASWIFTAHAMAYAMGMFLSHRMSHYFGNRRYVSMMATVGMLCTLASACSNTLDEVITFRLIGAFAGGTFLPRAMVFMAHRYIGKERGDAINIFSAVFIIIGRVLGPALMGLGVDHFKWRFLFLGALPFQIIGAIFLHRHAVDYWDEHVESYRPDLRGIFLLFSGVALFQVFLDRGEIEDWFSSSTVCLLALGAFLGNAAFLLWQLSPANKHPLIDFLHVSKRRGMLANAVLAIFFGIFLSASLFLLPTYLREIESERHSATQVGYFMAYAGFWMFVGLLMTNTVLRSLQKYGPRRVLYLISLPQLLAMLLFVPVLTSNTPDLYLLLPIALTSLYGGLMTSAITLSGFAGMELKELSNARTLYYASRALGLSLGVSLVNLVMDHRSTLHSQRLLEAFFQRAESAHVLIEGNRISSQRTLELADQVRQQATVLSLSDLCLILAGICVLTWLIIPLFPPQQKQAS